MFWRVNKNNLEFLLNEDDTVMEINSVESNGLKSIRNSIEKKIEENCLNDIREEYIMLQPEKFSFGRNNYVHVLKELWNPIKLNK